jgi:hypothetical protein
MGAEGDEVRPSSRVVMTFEANGTPFMFVRVVFHRWRRPIALSIRIPSFGGKGDRIQSPLFPELSLTAAQIFQAGVSVKP